VASGTAGAGVAENVNYSAAGTCYIKVYGYNSACSTTSSYLQGDLQPPPN
jgi:hypothetical protein